jgi:hypothetical protein
MTGTRDNRSEVRHGPIVAPTGDRLRGGDPIQAIDRPLAAACRRSPAGDTKDRYNRLHERGYIVSPAERCQGPAFRGSLTFITHGDLPCVPGSSQVSSSRWSRNVGASYGAPLR